MYFSIAVLTKFSVAFLKMSFGLNKFTVSELTSFNKLSLGVKKLLRVLLFGREKTNFPM